MASPAMVCTLVHGSTAAWSAGSSARSISTAMTRPARRASAVVSVPRPAPTSSTVSWPQRSAAARICSNARRLTRKCCPQRLRGRIPNARSARAVPAGVARSSRDIKTILADKAPSRRQAVGLSRNDMMDCATARLRDNVISMHRHASLSLHQFDEDTAGGGRMEKGNRGSSRSPPGCGLDEHAARGSRRRHRPANVGYAKRDVVQSWTMRGQELGKRTTLAQWLEQLEVDTAGSQERDAHTLIRQLVPLRHAQAKKRPLESSRLTH